HGRPMLSYAAYASLFAELAAAHAQDRREDGRISVRTRTLTVIDSGLVRGDGREQDLLSLSGLSFLDPADFAAQSWRFEPIWLHEYFVERFNQRRQPSNWPIALAFAVAVCLSPLITAGLAWRKRRRKFGRLP